MQAQSYDEKIAVLEAAKRGQAVQRKHICHKGRPQKDWMDFNPNETDFDFVLFVFRVKPAPRQLFMNEYSYGELCGEPRFNLAAADACAQNHRTAVIRFVEVERIPVSE